MNSQSHFISGHLKPMRVELRPPELLEAGHHAVRDMAVLHTRYMPDAMDEPTARALLLMPGTFAHIIRCPSGCIAGFVLWRVAADEAEILSLAVEDGFRQRGYARRLLQAAHLAAEARGAKTMFLEVAEDNHAARVLYQNSGFAMVGRRPQYYARKEQTAMDALILSLPLGPG